MKRAHSHSDGFSDLPESLKKSIAERLGERKCFYYNCYTAVFCSDSTPERVERQHPFRMVPCAIGVDSKSLREIPDARCRYCRIYCLLHLFAGEYHAQTYGPFND